MIEKSDINPLEVARMARTVIDVDDEALAEAARYLGTATKKDTVNAALREINDRRRRAAAIERMRGMVAEGRVDLDLIDEPGKHGGSGRAPQSDAA